jgi:glycosyltransferase involved in cell wall biosynthesis
MTILFLDQFNQPGGAQQCLFDLIAGVLERGWKAVVMLPGEGALGDKLRAMGVEVLPVACGPYASGHKTTSDLWRFIRDLWTAARQIAACRKAFRADLIYVNGPRLVPAAVLGTWGLPIVFHCHSLLQPTYLRWLTAMPLRLARARIIASSHFVAKPLLSTQRVTVIHNGVDQLSSSFPRRTGCRIGIVGRIAREKGHDLFLDAARILHERIPESSFVVCGAPLFSDPGYAAQIKRLAEGAPVEFTGWRNDIAPILARLDLLVVPSTPVDATPRIIMEAFSAGLPVVAFANEGFRELIDDGRTGYLVTTRTAEALAARIERALTGESRHCVAQAAYREWQARFSLAAYRANITEFLEREP